MESLDLFSGYDFFFRDLLNRCWLGQNVPELSGHVNYCDKEIDLKTSQKFQLVLSP